MTQAPLAPARFRLRRPASSTGELEPTLEQRQVIQHDSGRLKVLAGPGTGKSATLVEVVADRIARRGVSPEQILVLTFSRRAAGELTSRITRRLGITTREPLVRTLHSYAYSLLREHAVRSGEPSPRLLRAGESDHMVRELLAGQKESGRGSWPPAVSAALDSPAFAAELRDMMLRTAERGITPGRLAELGRRRHRPEWRAAALFAREYQDVSDLRQGSSGLGAALDQAELTRAALGLLADDTLLAAEQSRVRRVFVDEYQDVDPAQAKLIELLASGAEELIVFGDPDQSIYAFRGSDPAALRDIQVDRTVSLTVSRRLAPALLSASRRIAARLPGVSPHRELSAAPTDVIDPASVFGAGPVDMATGSVVVRTLPTAAREAAFLADELRRSHLRDGVPWSQMAVLVRSPAAALPALRRAFATSGIPIVISGQDSAQTAAPAVDVLLTVLRYGQEPTRLTGELALQLLGSPVVGMDGEALRRLRRQLRAAHPGAGSTPDLLAAVLAGAPLPDGLADDLRLPVLRIRAMLDAARAGAGDQGAEDSLWQVWMQSGLAESLAATSLRGGRAGQRADATLDAVLGLFTMAADLVEQMPLAGVGAFLDLVDGQRIPVDPTAGTTRSADAVAVLSAHAAKGLEWDVVCLAGVAEGWWPVLRTKPSLLGTDEALDAAAGIPPTADDGRTAIQEERRLFYVAATRAKSRLIATCVADQDTIPSRFLHELAGSEDDLPTGWPAELDGSQRRSLHLTDLVAQLRRVVTDDSVAAETGALAAQQLARLAHAGVVGAHPRDWYGLAERSTDLPPVPDGAVVAVSPSSVDSLTVCALRAVLERRGARGATSQQQIEGIVVHALVDGLAKGVGRTELLGEMERFLALQTHLPPWLLARTRRALESMLTAAEAWISQIPDGRELAGSEVKLSAAVPEPEDCDDLLPAREVRLEGRADRLDRLPDGSLVVVDFKTAVSVPSKAAVAENAQLAVYQLAIELGAAAGALDRNRPSPMLAGPSEDLSGVPLPEPPMEDPEEEPPFDEAEPAASISSTASARPNNEEPRIATGRASDPPTGSAAVRRAAADGRAGGAELVFLRSGSPTVRHQPPLTPDDAMAWRAVVREAAERLASSVSIAQENRYCDRCPVRSSCPLQPAGRQVTR
ncbi:MAG: ATP-dependent DNA helicase [Nakamurella sp.]